MCAWQGRRNAVQAFIQEYQARKWLFPGARQLGNLHEQSVQKVHDLVRERAWIYKGLSFHILRQPYPTHSLGRGTDLSHAQKLLSHRSLKTTGLEVPKPNQGRWQSKPVQDICPRRVGFSNRSRIIELVVLPQDATGVVERKQTGSLKDSAGRCSETDQ